MEDRSGNLVHNPRYSARKVMKYFFLKINEIIVLLVSDIFVLETLISTTILTSLTVMQVILASDWLTQHDTNL